MPSTDDIALLQSFVKEHSEAAFTTLVSRHIGLVYSAALRQTGSAPMAEEVTQAVFIILARKAGSLGKGVVLSGWLYQTARLTAANHLRAEIRRTRHEQEAYMNALDNENETSADAAAWQQIAPALETAMGSLSQSDRDAIVLRYFENKDIPSVAAALNATETTARKRISRAVERLRKFFSKRGITLSATAIGMAVSVNSVQAAPVGLIATASTMASKGSAVTASTAALVKITMKTMTWIKFKFALGVATAVLLTGGVVTVAICQTRNGDTLTVQDIAKASQNAYAALSSYGDTGTVLVESSGKKIKSTFSTHLQRPNFYRIEWTQNNVASPTKGIVWSDGTGNYLLMGPIKGFDAFEPANMSKMELAIANATGLSSTVASAIPGTFFNFSTGFLMGLQSPYSTAQRLADEKVGDVACYVLSRSTTSIDLPDGLGSTGTSTSQLWIGKSDHLIHKIQITLEGGTTILGLDVRLQLMGSANVVPTGTSRNGWKPSLVKAPSGKIVLTQTHENIVTNQVFSLRDFTRSP